jgi:type IV pilus assembly protein PilB
LSMERPDKAIEVRLGVFVDAEVLQILSRELAEKYRIIPLRCLGRGLLVGSDGELSRDAVQHLTHVVGRPVASIPCEFGDVEDTIKALYAPGPGHRRIGEILTSENLVTESELSDALERQAVDPKPLGQIFLELGMISEEELNRVLADQERTNNPSLLPSLFLDPQLTQSLPESVAQQHQVLPITISGDELVVATATHLESSTAAELTSLTGRNLHPIPAVPEEVRPAIEQLYGRLRRRRAKELRLGEVLIEEGLISQTQLDTCLAEQKRSGKKLGEILMAKGCVGEDAVLSVVANKLGCEYRRFATSEIDLDLSRFLPQRFAEQNHVLMLERDSKASGVLVAMADPADLSLRDILDGILAPHNLSVKPVLAAPGNIEAGIAYSYRSRGLIDASEEIETITTKAGGQDLESSVHTPEIKRMVNQLLYSAVVESASDIHIENLETSVGVRFRVDGVLEDRVTPISKENIANVISILKVDSGLDIAERRRSQDGVFKKRIGKDRFIDFRINVHATPFGEDAVIRILDRDKNLLSLEKLGFAESTLQTYLRLVENPQGLILFTGPTGSGKTTTLYSTLTYLNKGNRKIVTAEDPIEYVLTGISQYQVNETIGNTFDDYARRFLRKDPDIILIGEIRDNKTARACVNAAMTGHLVFSTLHTNDSVGVVRRLQNLDVAPSLIGDSLILVVSQRLARRICPHCRDPYTPSERLLHDFYPRGVPEGLEFVRGLGCEACRHKGFRGRVGLYEFWEVHPEARRLISRGAPEDEIREIALSEGMRVLLADALAKVAAQQTTLEELSRVVSIDQLQRYAAAI